AGGASALPAPAGPESAALPAETVPACAGDGSDGGDSGDGGRAHSAARWAAGVGALWAGTGATLGATFSSLHGAGAERTTWLMLGALAGAILGAAAGALGRLAGGRLAGAIELAAGGTVGEQHWARRSAPPPAPSPPPWAARPRQPLPPPPDGRWPVLAAGPCSRPWPGRRARPGSRALPASVRYRPPDTSLPRRRARKQHRRQHEPAPSTAADRAHRPFGPALPGGGAPGER